jgi:hypothetical protein
MGSCPLFDRSESRRHVATFVKDGNDYGDHR